MDLETFRMAMAAAVTPPGQQEWGTPGTYSFVVPNVTEISAVTIGPGRSGQAVSDGGQGGDGGDLRYAISIPVTPGETLTILIGSGTAPSRTEIRRGSTILLAAGNPGHSVDNQIAQYASTPIDGVNIFGGAGGHPGGASSSPPIYQRGNGGGGAGGYAGNGGHGGNQIASYTAGTGGGAAGGSASPTSGEAGWGGGGVGLKGQGASGTTNGQGGSGGSNAIAPSGINAATGGTYGGGGGGQGKVSSTYGTPGPGQPGGARIIHGGGRYYPSTYTQDL
jgi:hypothetical protein